jgi:hypothetical protein
VDRGARRAAASAHTACAGRVDRKALPALYRTADAFVIGSPREVACILAGSRRSRSAVTPSSPTSRRFGHNHRRRSSGRLVFCGQIPEGSRALQVTSQRLILESARGPYARTFERELSMGRGRQAARWRRIERQRAIGALGWGAWTSSQQEGSPPPRLTALWDGFWKGGYYEGDSLDPYGESSYAQNGFVSVIHAVYQVCIKPHVTPRPACWRSVPGRGAWTKAKLEARTRSGAST